MRHADPYQRTTLEVQILGALKDLGHPILLRDLISRLNPDYNESITCAVFDFQGEGLVTIHELFDGGHLIAITPQGVSILTAIYSGKARCD